MWTAMSLEALHEDEHLLVVAKPAGLLVHPTQLDAQETDSLIQRAEAQWGRRLYPAHRLDKGTSGLLLLAKDTATASLLGEAFREGRVAKRYLGLVRGWPPAEQGLIDHPLARDPERPSQGQPLLEAQTRWQLLRRLSWPVCTQPPFPETRGALLALEPLQGRRHQIRRHCKHISHPLIGDATHGKGPLNRALAGSLGLQRLWLHAWQLRLPDALGGLRLEAAPGPEWAQLLSAMSCSSAQCC
jgi:tRNA pseudouridine65 synthase